MRTFLLATLCAAAAPLFAQNKPLVARNFHFDDYRSVIVFDLKTLRDTGVWDEMNTSSLKMTAKIFEEQLGFSIDDLDRVTMTRGKYKPEGQAEVFEEISVLEGNADLGTGDVGTGRYNTESVGLHTLYLNQWGGGDAFAVPTPKLQVYGPAELLRDVLDGKPRNGLPSADVMAFTAGKKNCLMHFLVDLKYDEMPRKELEQVVGASLEGIEWPEGDAPTMIGGRVLATGDEDDPHVTFELVVRHGTVGKGLETSEKAVDAGIRMLKKMPQARLFWPMLKRIERERSGTDAVWRVDLGRARHADGLITTLAPFLFLAGTTRVVQGQAVQVIEVEDVVIEEPPAPKKEKKKEKPEQGGGK